jgi:hypothetical protein
MSLKCYHHLHPLFGKAIVDQGVDEDWTLLKWQQAKMNQQINLLIKNFQFVF